MRKLLRFNDLADRGIVNNRTTLYRWIHERGFPIGIKIGANMRVWPEDEVDAWVEAQRHVEQDALLRQAATKDYKCEIQ